MRLPVGQATPKHQQSNDRGEGSEDFRCGVVHNVPRSASVRLQGPLPTDAHNGHSVATGVRSRDQVSERRREGIAGLKRSGVRSGEGISKMITVQ
jgi:hypothetical protein